MCEYNNNKCWLLVGTNSHYMRAAVTRNYSQSVLVFISTTFSLFLARSSTLSFLAEYSIHAIHSPLLFSKGPFRLPSMCARECFGFSSFHSHAHAHYIVQSMFVYSACPSNGFNILLCVVSCFVFFSFRFFVFLIRILLSLLQHTHTWYQFRFLLSVVVVVCLLLLCWRWCRWWWWCCRCELWVRNNFMFLQSTITVEQSWYRHEDEACVSTFHCARMWFIFELLNALSELVNGGGCQFIEDHSLATKVHSTLFTIFLFVSVQFLRSFSLSLSLILAQTHTSSVKYFHS